MALQKHQDFELLAPAGDWAALESALEAGADAVYLGLQTLNARRRAKNFLPDEFVNAVEQVHARGANAYLTLNIDLAQRELGQAARVLELARQSRVDAVLVRDPALLALRAEYSQLDFHFSTQTCVTNSADVAAAGQLGANRVVLARELTLAEIAAASAVPGVQTEVFVQGALCFSVSGRCLLSSWVGARSGNRGTCTSPCRVPWSVDNQPAGTPLSMKDLSLVHRLPELRRAGVAALKIEGRLKNAAWVQKAVTLYKRALAGADADKLHQEAAELGAYTGRTMTNGFVDGLRDDLTGPAGRQSALNVLDTSPPIVSGVQEDVISDLLPTEPIYNLRLTVETKGLACSCNCGDRTQQWTIPKTVIRRPAKAISIGDLFDKLSKGAIHGYQLGRRETNDADFLLTPRAVNALMDRISSTIRLAQKMPDVRVRIDLPSSVHSLLTPAEPSNANSLCLGQQPDRVRLDVKAATAFLRHLRPKTAIIEGLVKYNLGRLLDICHKISLIAALPGVFFEHDIPAVKNFLQECASARITVEVNSWGGWYLAKRAGVAMEAGPGLPVLNALAARLLVEKGMKCVTISPEADRKQLEDLSAHCPVPCSLVVFGRPPLVTTRAQIPEKYINQILSDRRGAQMIPRHENGLCVFRPVEPFDLRACQNQRVRVRHLVVDLAGSDDPLGDWQNVPQPGDHTFQFNYNRTLV